MSEQQVETPVVEEAVVGEERPAWLPDKYDSPEAFAKSAAEAERALKQTQQQLHDERAQTQTMMEQLQQQQAQGQDLSAQEEQLLSAYEENPLGTMAYIAQQAAAQAMMQQQQAFEPLAGAQNELLAAQVDQMMATEHADDWQDVRPHVAALLQSDPDFIPGSAMGSLPKAKQAIERVYKLVKAEQAADKVQGLEAAQAGEARQQKLAAQTLSGSGKQPAASDDDAFVQRLIDVRQNKTYGNLAARAQQS